MSRIGINVTDMTGMSVGDLEALKTSRVQDMREIEDEIEAIEEEIQAQTTAARTKAELDRALSGLSPAARSALVSGVVAELDTRALPQSQDAEVSSDSGDGGDE